MNTQLQTRVPVDQLFDSIDVAIKNRQLDTSIKLLQRSLSVQPMTSHIALKICKYALLVDRFDIAQQAIRQALKQEPNNPMLWNRLALVQKRQGFIPQALRSYERAKAIDPANHEASYAFDCLKAYQESVSASQSDQQEVMVIKFDQLHQPLTLSVPPSALSWVENYKYNIVQYAKNAHATLSKPMDEKLHLLLYYFCDYILLDWVMLKPLLLSGADRMLNIGGGIGLFEPLIQSQIDRSLEYRLIELAEMNQVEHFAHEDEDYALSDPIRITQTARDVFDANGLGACAKAIDSENASSLMNESFDLIFSIRSLSFLYPLDTYLELILATLTPAGTLVLDVSKTNDDMQLLKQHFSDVQVMSEFAGASRTICRR